MYLALLTRCPCSGLSIGNWPRASVYMLLDSFLRCLHTTQDLCVLQFVELHGDRAGYDDPAIVTGIGTIDGERYMFMGHQKGRNTRENIQRNFGMPTPHG